VGNLIVDDAVFTANQRNGIEVNEGAELDNARITDSRFVGNGNVECIPSDRTGGWLG
jgi:hypothetical protein